jgi:hypothetical protein
VPYTVAAIGVVGLLCSLNLLLTLGIIRRLREHTEQLADKSPGVDVMLPVGSTVGEFAARTTDGEYVSRQSLSGETVVAFFSPGCAPCEELLPRFVDHVVDARNDVLAVIVGPEAEAAEMVTRLRPVAPVVLEGPNSGQVSAAFGVGGFPVICVVAANGRVMAAGATLTVLRPSARV